MEYPTHRMRLMPLLASYLAMFFTGRYVVDRYASAWWWSVGAVVGVATAFSQLPLVRNPRTCGHIEAQNPPSHSFSLVFPLVLYL
jgi:hypothetical protein